MMTMPSLAHSEVALPATIYLEPTNRCNLRCRTCVQHRGLAESARDMSLDEAKWIADQFPALEIVVLHGIGEPLLNDDIFGMVAYFKARGAYVLFNSNAILLDRPKAERLMTTGLDELRISLDAGSASTYAGIRPGASFASIVRNIEDLIALKAEFSRSTPMISAWMIGTRDNIHDLPDLVRLAARIGIEEVYLQRLVYFLNDAGHGAAVREQAIVDPPPQIQAVLDESMQLSRRWGIRLNASGLTSPEQSLRSESKSGAPWRRCRRPWESTYITVQGNVLSCCIAPFSNSDYAALIFGNVFAQRFEAIWHGDTYSRFRRRHQSFSPPPGCSGCGVEWSL